jgi:hypothetical protein
MANHELVAKVLARLNATTEVFLETMYSRHLRQMACRIRMMSTNLT